MAQQREEIPSTKRRNNSSPVWTFFIVCDDGRVKSKKCEKKYAKFTSTSTLTKHLSNVHNIELVAEKMPNNSDEESKKSLKLNILKKI
jgi:hypothetical protein